MVAKSIARRRDETQKILQVKTNSEFYSCWCWWIVSGYAGQTYIIGKDSLKLRYDKSYNDNVDPVYKDIVKAWVADVKGHNTVTGAL